MQSVVKPDVVMLGAGNVATHLAIALQQKGYTIKQVFSLRFESARMLASRFGASYCNRIDDVDGSAGLYIIALRDQVVEEVVANLFVSKGILVHTSGTLGIGILSKSAVHYGVFYPLQTFSKARFVDLGNVPFCLEASDEKTMAVLRRIAGDLSDDVREMDTVTRQYTHLAAVFACNYSNFMYVIASEILKTRQVPFEVLLPLIHESLHKVRYIEPWEAQTGPAIRHDTLIIEKHLAMLNDFPEYRELYSMISKLIKEKKKAGK